LSRDVRRRQRHAVPVCPREIIGEPGWIVQPRDAMA